jgi:superfamily II DNA or RNA helicase
MSRNVVLRNTPGGVLLSSSELEDLIGERNMRIMRSKLTTERVNRLGNRILSKDVRKYFQIIDIVSKTGEDESSPNGAKQKQQYFVTCRWCPFTSYLLAILPELRLDYKCTIPDGEPVDFALTSPDAEPLHDNQKVVIEYLLTNIYTERARSEGLAGCILVAGTGDGKTYMSAAMAARLGRKTLVVMPNTNNIDEWERVLTERYRIKVGKYYTNCKEDGDVVLTTIQSVNSGHFKFKGTPKDEPGVSAREWFRRFGLVIYDEAHNYATQNRHEIFWHLNTRCVLGLTATPDERADRLDEVYQYHIGPLVEADQIPGYAKSSTAWIGEVHVLRYHGPEQYTQRIVNSSGWTDACRTNQQCASDPYRNAMLIFHALELAKEGRNIYIFSEYRSYLDRIERLLRRQYAANNGISYSYPERAITQMTGGMKETQKQAAKIGEIILVTYGYATESLSIVRMDTIILATPRRRKIRQTIGRILRRGGDASIPRLIYDIVDVNTPMAKQFPDRRKIYKEKEFAMDLQDVDYEDYEEMLSMGDDTMHNDDKVEIEAEEETAEETAAAEPEKEQVIEPAAKPAAKQTARKPGRPATKKAANAKPAAK